MKILPVVGKVTSNLSLLSILILVGCQAPSYDELKASAPVRVESYTLAYDQLAQCQARQNTGWRVMYEMQIYAKRQAVDILYPSTLVEIRGSTVTTWGDPHVIGMDTVISNLYERFRQCERTYQTALSASQKGN